MTTIEKVKSIQDIARKNSLSLDKKFTEAYLTSHSMFPGPQEVADRIVTSMWEMCTHGINNGFDGACKSAINGLSGIVVDLTEVGNDQIGKLGKLSTKADAILRKELQSRKDGIDVSFPIRECVQSSLEAIDVMEELCASGSLRMADRQIDALKESRILLDEMTDLLNNVGDISSKTAQEKADAAIAAIKIWRDACSRSIVTSTHVNSLRKAKDEIVSWTKLTEGVTKKERAKDEHKFKANDNLAVIVEGKSALEMLDTFRERMSVEKEELEQLREEIENGANARQAQIDAYDAEYNELTKQIQGIVAAFQNGEYDLPTSTRLINGIKAKQEDVLYKKEVLLEEQENEMPNYLAIDVEQRETIYKQLDKVTRGLEGSRRNLVLLADLVYDIDFNVLIDMLGGNVTPDKMSEAMSNINGIVSGLSYKAQNGGTLVQRFGLNMKSISQMVDLPETNQDAIRERARARAQQQQNEIPPELLAVMGGAAQPQQKTAEERPKLGEKRSTLFSDDDR